MATNTSQLQPISNQGSLRGFTNLFLAELGSFWKTRKWWIQSLIWLIVCNGILALVIWTEGNTPDPSLMPESLELYTIFVGMFGSIGFVLNMQGALVGEKREGQAEWIMSKPVTRAAYILAKLVGNLINLTLIIIILQGVVAFLQISAATGIPLNPFNFALGTGALILHGWYYLALTLMLGSFFNTRFPVIGIPLGIMFLQQFMLGLAPKILIHILPTTLALPILEYSTASELINGLPVTVTSVLYTAPLFSILFVALAVWRFSREEF